MASTPQEIYQDILWAEFDATVTDFDVAKELVETNDPAISFDDMREIMFDEYCEHRG